MTTLAGSRIVVCRPPGRSDELVRRLTGRGARVDRVPLVDTVERPGAAAELRRALTGDAAPDWLVVTSAAGAAVVTGAVGCPPAGTAVAAVGPATAAAVTVAGWPVALVAARSVAEGLVEEFPDPPPGGGRVVVARAALGRDAVARGLAGRGWDVTEVLAYDTVDVPLDETGRRLLSAADAVAVTSSSIARRLVAELGAGGLPPRVVSIGPATTATLEGLGVAVAATAEPHTAAGLARALEAVLGGGP